MATQRLGDVEVVLLDGGGFTTTDDTRIHASGHDQPYYLYNWCFYIYHRATGRKLLWDLGISDLTDLDVGREEIDTIIFSHAHWDQCRPSKGEFPNAKVFFGPETGAHCSPGHIVGGEIQPMVQWDSRFFGDEGTCTDSYQELQGEWKPWGPFQYALDFFGDGSFWVLQAPGHMAGNLAACLRLGSGEQVLLASDCCHSRDIFLGIKQIANVPMPDGSRICLHESLDVALNTLGALREAVDKHGMRIAMAHDAEFIKDGKDSTLMSLLHPMFDEACLARIRAHQRP